jgi:hypothetical protein
MRTLEPIAVLRHRARKAALDRGAGDALAATGAVAALHGTAPATVHLSLWARTPLRPIQDVADELRAALEARELAARLQEALGGEVAQPRFPTPLTKELVGR